MPLPGADISVVIEADASPGTVVVDADTDTLGAERPGCVSAAVESSASQATVVEGGPPGPAGATGPTGPQGPDGTAFSAAAAIDLNAFRVVTSNSAGGVEYASADQLAHAHKVLGITLTASLQGGSVTVVTQGPMDNDGWSWLPGQPLYLGLGGEITAAQVGLFSLCIGHARTPRQIFVRIGRPILRS